MEEKEYEQLDFDSVLDSAEEYGPADEPVEVEGSPVEETVPEAEDDAPYEFMAEYEAARKYTYRTDEDKEEAEKKAAASELKKKQAMRRRIATAVAGLLALLILGLLIRAVVRKLTPKETVNVGPLPSEEVSVVKVPKYYDYTKPVPSGKTADGSYFSDALFIGDSRVQSLDLYGVGSFGKLLYGSNITVANADSYTCKSNDGESISLTDALSSRTYGKIYLSFGLNELGWSYSDVFADDYAELLAKVRKLQPDAVIYLVGIFDVTSGKSEASDWLNNTKIAQYNSIIMKLAADSKVYYINSNEAMTVEGGGLNPDYTGDGVFLLADGSEAWFEYFRSHTVNPDEYAN